jgi:two-component system, OmpR family, sensor histidine kinase KdpD
MTRPLTVSGRRAAIGATVALILVIVLAAGMLPLRSHLSVATTALVLVIPVVVGVTIGGFVAGVAATASGFLVYDFVFVPPYYTMTVSASQDWVALGVYVVVMLVVARVVAHLDAVRAEAQLRADELRRLFDLSELLVREAPAPELLDTIVTTMRQAFALDGAALLLPAAQGLELRASAGEPLSDEDLYRLSAQAGVPVRLGTAWVERGSVQAVVLVASGQAIGLLALRGLGGASKDRDLLQAFANHLALALERAQLREQAVRAQLLEQVDRLRRALVGAVSHDLRTPLATIKVSTSTLLDPEATVSNTDASELIGLIDAQTDRLNRLVSNLLDMTRIQSGTLELRRQAISVPELVNEAMSVLGRSSDLGRVRWQANGSLPLVDADHVLICQVLANLIDNATRYAPGDSPVTVSAIPAGRSVEVAVTDSGPGVPADEQATVFQMFNQREAGGRGGLGLAIAKAFVEAHGERIWVDGGMGQGARFVFTLPVSTKPVVS